VALPFEAMIERAQRLVESQRTALGLEGKKLSYVAGPLYCYAHGDGKEFADGVVVSENGRTVATVWMGVDGEPRRIYTM
jgi:hypothetical protein